MWIRPHRQMLARMPSMRPQPASTPPAPGSVADMQQQRKAAQLTPPPTLPPLLSEEEERRRAGGFHESSYELRTGMDIVESDWPEDVTIPGALDGD
jgi:hypothetical protein